jgi:hypothetical protein
MEPFTLIVWLMMGWRYDDPMGAEQCLELLFAIQADRSRAFQSDRTPAKGECVAGKLRLPRTIRELPPGDWGPLPGRRRV